VPQPESHEIKIAPAVEKMSQDDKQKFLEDERAKVVNKIFKFDHNRL
jgi:hypothetical protein